MQIYRLTPGPPDIRRIVFLNIRSVSFYRLFAAFLLCRHQIEMRIQHHIPELRPGQKVFPRLHLKSVVENDPFVPRHMGTEPVVSILVKLPQKFQRIGRAALRQLPVHRRITRRHVHKVPHGLCDRFIDGLNPKKGLLLSVPFCKTLQHFEHISYFLRRLAPPTYAADAAVVEVVLSKRRRVQIDQYLQAVLFRPGKSPVQLLHTAQKRRTVSKDKIRNRDTDRIHPHPPDRREIALQDIFPAVHPDPRFIYFSGKLLRKHMLILRRCPFEEHRTHPFLQHQPVSQIDSFDIHGLSPCYSSASARRKPGRCGFTSFKDPTPEIPHPGTRKDRLRAQSRGGRPDSPART